MLQARITNNGATTSYTYTSTGTRSNKIEGIETTTYISNDDNMISQITVDGTTTNFYYNADNKRIKKTQGLASTLYFDQDFEIINGTFTLYVFAGNLRVAKVTDKTLEYYHKDHLGSTNAISRQDGTLIDFGEYLPYGLDRSNNDLLQTSSYKFTDQEQDDGTGLYNYDARLYDPVIGQFIMADTIVPDLFNPQSLNRYAYCSNNPVRYVDPTGHWTDHGDDGNYGGDGGNSGSGSDSGDRGGYPDWGGAFDNDPNTAGGNVGNGNFGATANSDSDVAGCLPCIPTPSPSPTPTSPVPTLQLHPHKLEAPWNYDDGVKEFKDKQLDRKDQAAKDTLSHLADFIAGWYLGKYNSITLNNVIDVVNRTRDKKDTEKVY